MSVTSVDKDLDNLTLTVVADFDAPVEKVWQLWEDPRKLERWWGPPTYPATMEQHDLSPGGEVLYYMTSPEGEKYRGWWRITSIEPPRSMEFLDGFADQDGAPIDGLPVSTVRVALADHQSGTRMEMRSIFASLEQMEQVLEMGMEEGLTAAVGQMDALLVDEG